MGYTLSLKGDEGHAMEGACCYGRTDAVCDPPQGRRKRPRCVASSVSHGRRAIRSSSVAKTAAKKEKPRRGARQIRERLLRKLPHAIQVPQRARFMPFWTGMVWSAGRLARARAATKWLDALRRKSRLRAASYAWRRSSPATSVWPRCSARLSGLAHAGASRLGSAPFVSRYSTISRYPARAAAAKGVMPSSLQ